MIKGRSFQFVDGSLADALRRRRPSGAVRLLITTAVAFGGSAPLVACNVKTPTTYSEVVEGTTPPSGTATGTGADSATDSDSGAPSKTGAP